MMLKDDVPEPADPHQTKEPGILDLVCVELVSDQYIIPVISRIVVFYESFDFI
jgi:hypothetical protein